MSMFIQGPVQTSYCPGFYLYDVLIVVPETGQNAYVRVAGDNADNAKHVARHLTGIVSDGTAVAQYHDKNPHAEQWKTLRHCH